MHASRKDDGRPDRVGSVGASPTADETDTMLFHLVRSALSRLGAAGARYFVIRYASEHSPGEGELDVLAPPRQRQKLAVGLLRLLPEEVKFVASECGLLAFRLVLARVRGPEAAVPVETMVVDIREAIAPAGAVLADHRAVAEMGPARTRDGLPLPSESAEAALLIARNTWARRSASPRHQAILAECWTPAVNDRLPDFLTRASGTDLDQVLASATRLPAPPSRTLSRVPAKITLGLRHADYCMVRWSRRRPSVLAIHGPDGVGKTTAAAGVVERLGTGVVRCSAQHYSGGPITPEYVEAERLKAETLGEPPKAKVVLRGLIWRALLYPPRHLQFHLDIGTKAKWDVVVYDRFSYDHLFKGQAAGLPQRVRRFLARLGSWMRLRRGVVDAMLVLDAPEIRRRKAELPVELIVEYYACASSYFGTELLEVDARGTPAEVSYALVQGFLDAIDRKNRSQLRAESSRSSVPRSPRDDAD